MALLRLDPAETLVVERLDTNADQDEVNRTFTIINRVDSNICFKIRSTAPDRASVKPICDYIRGLDVCEVVLTARPGSFAAGRSKEKLLISAVKCTLPTDDWDSISPARAWKLMSSSEMFETKIAIKFKDMRSSTGDGPPADLLKRSGKSENATPERRDLVFKSLPYTPKASSEPDELSGHEEPNVQIDDLRLKNFVDGKGFDVEVVDNEDKFLKIERENKEAKSANSDTELLKELMDLRNSIRGTHDSVLSLKRNVEFASREVEKNQSFINEQIDKYDMKLNDVVRDFEELKDMKKNYVKQIEDLEKVMMSKVERMLVVQTDRCNNRFEDMLRRSLQLQEDKIKDTVEAVEVMEGKFKDNIRSEIRISEDRLVAIIDESSERQFEELMEVIERIKTENGTAEIEKVIKAEIGELYDEVKSKIRSSEAITMRVVDEKLQKCVADKKDDEVDSSRAAINVPKKSPKNSTMIMVGIATGFAISSSLVLLHRLLKK